MVSEAERHVVFVGIACLVLTGAVVASLYTAAELFIGLRRSARNRSSEPVPPFRRQLDATVGAVLTVLAIVGSVWLVSLVASTLRQLRS